MKIFRSEDNVHACILHGKEVKWRGNECVHKCGKQQKFC